MDADHVTAWSKGGSSTAENCQMLCVTTMRQGESIMRTIVKHLADVRSRPQSQDNADRRCSPPDRDTADR